MEGLVDASVNSWLYDEFHNLEHEFKSGMIATAIQTVIYIGATIFCYHIAFNLKENNKNVLSGD